MFFYVRFFSLKIIFLLSALLCLSVALGQNQKKTGKKKTDAHWSRLITVAKQLDAIDREAWWVLLQQRPPLTKSIFGKIQRAAQNEEGQKLTQKNLFSCDKYNLTRKILSSTGFPQRISAYHSCHKNQELFAEIDWKQKEKLEITFFPGPLVDVLGLNASILGTKITCDVSVDSSGIVQSFSCKNTAKDRNATELVELDVYEFKKQNSSQLTLKGKVTEHLIVKRKIESVVPLEGKIKVTETEIVPPPGYRNKLPAVKTPKAPAPPPSVPSENPSPNPAVPLENPDSLVKKIEQQQQLNPGTETRENVQEALHPEQIPLPEPEYIEDNAQPQHLGPQKELPPSRR